ncbi:MAG: 2-hydroxyacyl-CoA dehydratase family protein [Bacillota bacterium]
MNPKDRYLENMNYSRSKNENYISRLKKESGKPVIGYLCCFAPPEMISAAGMIPYRITGQPGGDTSAADACVEPYGCTYVRNIFARSLEGELEFLDGLVISHSCDMVQRLYGIWTYYRPLEYSYLFNVPHQLTPWAKDFFRRELGFFQESLESFTGQKVSPEKLAEEIKLYNANRALIREIYALRQENSPRLKGSKMLDLLMAGGTLPAAEYNVLLQNTLQKLKEQPSENKLGPRIMIWGSIMDHPALFKMIEEAGGNVVCDDTCIGFRVWEKDIPQDKELYEGLTEHYFVNFQCPRTDRGPGAGRFEYILQKAREYNVDGVIGYCISFCDPHKFDYPDLHDYLKKEGLPMLLIEDNYSFEPAEAIKTRVQAFIETL